MVKPSLCGLGLQLQRLTPTTGLGGTPEAGLSGLMSGTRRDGLAYIIGLRTALMCGSGLREEPGYASGLRTGLMCGSGLHNPGYATGLRIGLSTNELRDGLANPGAYPCSVRRGSGSGAGTAPGTLTRACTPGRHAHAGAGDRARPNPRGWKGSCDGAGDSARPNARGWKGSCDGVGDSARPNARAWKGSCCGRRSSGVSRSGDARRLPGWARACVAPSSQRTRERDDRAPVIGDRADGHDDESSLRRAARELRSSGEQQAAFVGTCRRSSTRRP